MIIGCERMRELATVCVLGLRVGALRLRFGICVLPDVLSTKLVVHRTGLGNGPEAAEQGLEKAWARSIRKVVG